MRIFGILLLIVSLCACSCVRPTQIRCEPVTEFQCTITCRQEENTYIFDLKSHSDGTFSADILQPENLTGVCFLYDENGYTIDANGVSDTFGKDSFTSASPVRMLFEAMQCFLFTGTETLTDKGDGTYTASAMISAVPVYADFSADGVLHAIRYPDRKTVFSFSYDK